MAPAVNRTGVILKKCDTSNHRPETVKQCAAGTCQHTCKPDTIEKRTHVWTPRYWVNGKQLEKSVKDVMRNGRVVYGSGRKLAQDFQLKLTLDKRSGDITFALTGVLASRTSVKLPKRSSRACRSLTAARTTTLRHAEPCPRFPSAGGQAGNRMVSWIVSNHVGRRLRTCDEFWTARCDFR